MDSDRRAVSWLRHLPALLWPLLLVAASLECNFRYDWFSRSHLDWQPIESELPEAREFHDMVHAYLFSEGMLAFDNLHQIEIDHFHDVKNLLDLNRFMLVVAAPFLLLMTICFRRRWEWMRTGGSLVFALGAAFGLLLTRWVLFSRAVHPVFFPGGSWDFNPEVHNTVKVYTAEYIGGQTAWIVIPILVFGALIFFLGHWRSQEPQAKTCLRLTKTEGIAALAGAVMIVITWRAGTMMLHPYDLGTWIYYAASSMAFGGFVCLLCSRWKLAGVILVLSGFLSIQAAGLAAAQAHDKAVETTTVAGNLIIGAIRDYTRDHRQPPEQLDQLVGDYLSELPEITVGEKIWCYEYSDVYGFHLYFIGPLGAYYQYNDSIERWTYPPRP